MHDPEIGHGRKSAPQRFEGFERTPPRPISPEPLLTAITVTAANEPDGRQAKALVESGPPEHRPERPLGDTAYGTGAVRAELADDERDGRESAATPSESAIGA